MPRYDTLDCHANLSELDPCLAAEIRLKDKHQYNWKIIGGGITVLLLLVIGVVLACTLTSSGSPTKVVNTNKPTVEEVHVQPPKPANIPIIEVTTTQAPTVQPTTTQAPTVKPTLPPVRQASTTQSPKVPPVITRASRIPLQTTTSTQAPTIQVTTTPEPSTTEQTQPQTTTSPQPSQEASNDQLSRVPRHSHISASKVEMVDTSDKLFATCDEYKKNGFMTNGVYRLQQPDGYDFLAQCVMDSEDRKAWMVLQKRTSDSLVFWNRTFDEYSQGFGDPCTDSWLGLKQVRQMIESGYKLQLRMEMEGERCASSQEDSYYVGTWNFEVWISFQYYLLIDDLLIDSEKDDYRLHVSKMLSGNFTDPLASIAQGNGLAFNAVRPNAPNTFSCLERVHMGGWWSVKNGCSFISLNGEYSCTRQNSMYGLSVFYRRPLGKGNGAFTTSYIRPSATRMMLRVCNGEKDCL